MNKNINLLNNKDNRNNNENEEQEKQHKAPEAAPSLNDNEDKKNSRNVGLGNESLNNNLQNNSFSEADNIIFENINAQKLIRTRNNTETLHNSASSGNKVTRRRKTSAQDDNDTRETLNRASVAKMEGLNDSQEFIDMDGSDDGTKLQDVDSNVPEWVVIGESVLIRPYNTSGVISYIGSTHFQPGTWIGVDLDTPTGKNDGTVQGIQYFQCKLKHGIFVRSDKLIHDKRGKAMRAYKAEKQNKESIMTRSKSRSEALNVQTSGRK